MLSRSAAVLDTCKRTLLGAQASWEWSLKRSKSAPYSCLHYLKLMSNAVKLEVGMETFVKFLCHLCDGKRNFVCGDTSKRRNWG